MINYKPLYLFLLGLATLILGTVTSLIGTGLGIYMLVLVGLFLLITAALLMSYAIDLDDDREEKDNAQT